MSQINVTHCAACGRDNDPGMSFCMFCGERISTPVPKTTASTPVAAKVCTSCGRVDDLNNTFCIYCGGVTAPMSTPVPGGSPAASVSVNISSLQSEDGTRGPALPPAYAPTLDMPYTPAAVTADGSRAEPSPLKSILLSAAAGVVAGIIVISTCSGWIEQQVARSSWPTRGLVVFVSPAKAQVLIEESRGANFTLGRTGPDGALSFPDLPPGEYKVTVSAAGYKPLSEQVQVGQDQLATLGFPGRLELEKLPI